MYARKAGTTGNAGLVLALLPLTGWAIAKTGGGSTLKRSPTDSEGP